MSKPVATVPEQQAQAGLEKSALAGGHLLKDSRGSSRGTEEDLARRLPAGTGDSAPPGSLHNLSVDLLAKEREREKERADVTQ